jgi:dual specificity tyrosine-phosphorylation-regulated kinase 2/3/4
METKAKKKFTIERGYHRPEKLQIRSPPSATVKNISLNLEPKTSTLSRANILKIGTPKQLSTVNSIMRLQRNLSYQLSPNHSSSSSRIQTPKADVQFPLQAKAAISLYPNDFNKLEQLELIEYQILYFLGSANKIKPTIDGNNNGYDDERGDYIVHIGDHIAYRYEILKVLGKGSFGIVVECFDYKRSEKVALKIIKNKSRFHQQAAVEIKVLQQLRENDIEGKYNVVKIKNYFIFRKHICITFELLSLNLYELLRQNHFEGFSLTLIHRFAVQLLVCLQYIAKQKVIHCDLKPENILLKDTEKALINVIDFGSSCFENERVYYYIQSRFYRAPEIILGINYTTAIDMWSLGCILAELFIGRPIFPGESEHVQLVYIMQVLGVPSNDVISRAKHKDKFFDSELQPKIIENKKGVVKMPGTRPLNEALNGSPSSFVDFVSKCLVWDPDHRLKPIEGLDHPWITEGLKRKMKG